MPPQADQAAPQCVQYRRTSAAYPLDGQPRGLDYLDLAATSTAPAVAELFVDVTLRHWGCSALISDARVVAVELVADAVACTGVPGSSRCWTERADVALLRVRLALLADAIVIEVADRHDQPPTLSASCEARCRRSDWCPANGGRIVRAELAVPNNGGGKHRASPLSKRHRKATPVPAATTDPELLERLVKGLRAMVPPSKESTAVAVVAPLSNSSSDSPAHGESDTDKQR